MSVPSAYRLEARRDGDAVVFEFTEAETGRVVGSAREEAPPIERPNRAAGFLATLSESRWFGWLLIPVGLVVGVGYVIALVLGLAKPPRRRKPSLCVRRPETGETLFQIRDSSGLLYDSRVVSDGQGRPVVQLRGPFKTVVGRAGFGVIDLGETTGPRPSEGPLPWLGHVSADGDGAYRLELVLVSGAGRIVEDRPPPDNIATGQTAARYDIEIGPGLREDERCRLLLLASALALAWRPR